MNMKNKSRFFPINNIIGNHPISRGIIKGNYLIDENKNNIVDESGNRIIWGE